MQLKDKVNTRCRVFVVTSGKGGVGKSTVACGLAAALSARGRDVLLIDADEGLSCLDLMLGVAEEVMFDLGDVIGGGCSLLQAVYPVAADGTLGLMPAPKGHGALTPEKMQQVISEARQLYDFIIIDSTAGVGSGFQSAAFVADEALDIVSPDPVCIRDAARLSRILADSGIKKCRMIINRFDYHAMKRGIFPDIDRIIDSAAFQLIGIVPTDGVVPVFAAKGKPVVRGRAARAFGRIADRILGKNMPLPNLKKI